MIHLCHHPECNVPVQPKYLACRNHWYMLPQDLRSEVWRTYRKGQEHDKQPSKEYMEVVARVQEYWRKH